VLVGTVLHGGSVVFGYVEVAMVAGGICGSVLVAVISRLNPMTGVAAGLAGTGLCAIGTGLSSSLWLTLALFFLMGLSLAVTNAPLIGALQTHTPQHMMGRMFSAFGTCMSLVAPAALAFGGRLSDWMGPGKVFMLGGALVLTTAIGFLVLKPKVRIQPASQVVS
jgi:sugar phosphate permease